MAVGQHYCCERRITWLLGNINVVNEESHGCCVALMLQLRIKWLLSNIDVVNGESHGCE